MARSVGNALCFTHCAWMDCGLKNDRKTSERISVKFFFITFEFYFLREFYFFIMMLHLISLQSVSPFSNSLLIVIAESKFPHPFLMHSILIQFLLLQRFYRQELL